MNNIEYTLNAIINGVTRAIAKTENLKDFDEFTTYYTKEKLVKYIEELTGSNFDGCEVDFNITYTTTRGKRTIELMLLDDYMRFDSIPEFYEAVQEYQTEIPFMEPILNKYRNNDQVAKYIRTLEKAVFSGCTAPSSLERLLEFLAADYLRQRDLMFRLKKYENSKGIFRKRDYSTEQADKDAEYYDIPKKKFESLTGNCVQTDMLSQITDDNIGNKKER